MCSFGSPDNPFSYTDDQANIYLFQVNNRNTRKICEICSKSIIKTSKLRQRRRSGVIIVNFENISNLLLKFLLLTLNRQIIAAKEQPQALICLEMCSF